MHGAFGGAHLFGQPVPIVGDAGIDGLQIDGLGPLRLRFHLVRLLAVFVRSCFDSHYGPHAA